MMTLRSHLRATTAPQHARVDTAFSAFQLGQPDGYRAFLLAHAEVLLPLEIALEQSGIEAMLEDWPQRSRRQALLEDLAEIGALAPVAPPILAPLSPSACWGVAYVIEGSRLGGRVLARRVADANPCAPLRYLSHRSTTPLWPSFLERLEQQEAVADWSQMLAGANDTFERFLAAAQAHRP